MPVTDPVTVTDLDDRRYDYVPLPDRPPLRWPGGATVAFYPIVLVEYLEEEAPEGAVVAGDVFGGLGPGGVLRHPQITRVGNRDYGHRVGFFRLMARLEELGITPVVAIDAMAAEAYPAITAWLAGHDAEVLAHGVAVTRAITSNMTMAEEDAYITDARARIETAVGKPTRGWLGSASSQSGRTLQLLADAGFDYCLDWPNDEQPYWFATDPGLLSLPPILDLSDNQAINQRGLTNQRYSSSIVDAARRLARDGETAARLLSFTVNPFTSGQPARSLYLARALAEVVSIPGVWVTTPAQVAAAMTGPGAL